MYSYGSPVPLTDIKLLKKPIHRGDIVIFPYPRDPDIDYIKRVVGMPGETLEIRKDQVYINGKLFEESYAYFDPDQRKMMGGAASYPVSNYGPVEIPEGKLLLWEIIVTTVPTAVSGVLSMLPPWWVKGR